MEESPIIINAHFQAAPGREKELASALQALVAPSRKEPGCLAYELHFDPEDPARFMFYEKFAGQAAIDLHILSPHFKNFQSYLQTHDGVIATQTVTKWRSVEAAP